MNVDDLDNCLMFGMFYISCVGVYDNQMDRSRQEFAAMYDVRVKINPKICKLTRNIDKSPESCLGDRTSNRAGARERKSFGE